MLSFFATFGSSKGMVKMPDLSGLTRPQAIAAIENAGLIFSGSSTETTSNSSLSDKIKTQEPSANTLLDYESLASFIYYSYVPYVPTVTYGSPGVYAGANITSSYVCVDYGQNNTDIETVSLPSRRDVYFDGVFAYEEETQPQTVQYINYRTARCGWVAPAKTCTANCGTYTAWSSCKILYGTGGEKTRTRTCTRSDCSTYTQVDSDVCCTAGCFGSWSSWSASAGGVQERSRTCQRSDCSQYTDYETRCTVRTVTGSCGACTKKAPFRRTCSTTTTNADCSQTPGSVSQAC
jgi:hypothetical protein